MRGRARGACGWVVLCALGWSSLASAQGVPECVEGGVARGEVRAEGGGEDGPGVVRAALAPELVAEAWWVSGAGLARTVYSQQWRVVREQAPERGLIVSLAWRWGGASAGRLAYASACLRPGWDVRRSLVGDAARDEELDGSGWTIGGMP